jgi:tRNA(fMet)-specific endonuclease VapC
MVLLDTDHMTLLERSNLEGAKIRARLRNIPPDDAATSIISYEEQMRGWLARIAASTTADHQVTAYRELKRQLRNYCIVPVLDYDSAANAEYERLRKMRLRIGTMDLKIAAIALVNDATLLTRNLKDFGKVNGLKIEDWSV